MPGEWYRSIPAFGTNRTVTDVASFDLAYTNSLPGDRITMHAGTYTMNRAIGKANLQIVAFGWPGNTAEHVIINGSFSPVTASGCWFIGLEITDPAHTSTPTGLIFITNPNTSIINCWLHHSGHDEVQSISDFGADVGGGTLAYGNVMHDSRHVVYVQNKSTNASKYYAHNYLSDAIIDPEGQGEFLFHHYSSSDNTKIRNVYVLENVFRAGNCLEGGGDAAVNYGNRWERNLHSQSNWQGTYDHPGELLFKDNRMYKQFNASGWAIDCQRIHGAGETHESPNYPQQNTVTGNLIYRDGAGHMRYGTSYVVAGSPPVQHVWDGAIQSTDNVNNNDFRGSLLLEHRANGIGFQDNTLAGWRTDTSNNGCQYDLNSTLTAGAPPDFYQIFQNDYDPDRAMIFAWSNNATIPIVLPRTGSIYEVKDQWAAVAPFSGGTNYSLPTAGVAYIGIVKYASVGTPAAVRSSSSNSGSGTAVTVTAPVGTVAGDLMIVVVHANEINSVVTITDNNGATPFTEDIQEFQAGANSNGGSVSVFSRRIVAGDPASYAFTLGSSQRWGVGAVCISNPHPSEIYDTTSTTSFYTGSSITTVDVPSITTVTAGAIHLSCAFPDNLDNQTTTTPTGYTKIINTLSQNVTICHKTYSVPASSGVQTLTCSANTNSGGISLAIKSSVAASDPNPGSTVYGQQFKSHHGIH